MASKASRLFAAGLLCAGLLCAPAALAATPAEPFAMAVVDRAGPGAVSVTETVSQPGGGVFALWPGAYDASVPAGLAALVQNRFTVPQGVSSAQVKFYVHMPASGVTVHWPFPSRVGMLWILVGKGLSLPVILNQAFAQAPPTVWNGADYRVYSAKDVRQSVVVNLQYAGPQVSPWQGALPWLWLIPVVLVGYLVLRRLRWRTHA